MMGSKKHASAGFALLLAAGMVGCGGAGDTAPDTQNVTAAQEKLLAQVDLGYGSVQFDEVTIDGIKAYSVSETAPGNLESTPFQALVESGKYTSLEIFLAIAPGKEAPVELVAAQSSQALALGRNSDEVLVAKYDPNTPVKKSAASCEAWTLQLPTGGADGYYLQKVQRSNSVSGGNLLAVGNGPADWGNWTSASVALGICNESSSAVQGRLWYDLSTDSSGWIARSWATLNPGYMWRWWNFSYATSGPDCSGTPLCLPNAHPARYGVEGSGALYDLRTAEIIPYWIIY
jgi:hypothetical protein